MKSDKLNEWFRYNRIQSIIALMTLFSLGAYIVFSSIQSCQTKKMILSDRVKTRAYIEFSDFTIDNFKIGEKIIYVLSAKNVGFTPAFNVKMIGKIKIATIGVTKSEIDYINNVKNAIGEGSIKSAGTEFSINFNPDIILNDSDYKSIINGQKFFYIYGCVFYNDIFGVDHWHRFYLSYVQSTDRFTECIKYNDTDKNEE